MENNKEIINKEEKEDIIKDDKKESETSNDITEKDFNELNNDISKLLIEMKKEKDCENENFEEDEKELNDYNNVFSSNTISTCSMDYFDNSNNDQTVNKSKIINNNNNNNNYENNLETINMLNSFNSIQNETKFDSEKNINNNNKNIINNLDNNNRINNFCYNNIFNNDNNNYINDNKLNNIDNNGFFYNNNKEIINNQNYMNNYMCNINNKYANNNNSLKNNNGINLNNNINIINNNYNYINFQILNYKNYITSFSSCSADKNKTDSPKNLINLDNVLKGQDKRTTIIMRNIPNQYTISKLLREINKKFYHKYDVVYLPKNLMNNINYGYAFVNFIDYMHLVFFCDLFEGKKWNCINCNKRCQLAYSKYQGKDELLNYIHKTLGIESDFNTNDNLKNSFFINDSDKYVNPPIEIPIKYFIHFKTYYPFSLCHSKNDKIFIIDKF